MCCCDDNRSSDNHNERHRNDDHNPTGYDHHHHRGDDDIIVHQHDGEPNHEHDVTTYNDKLGYDIRACHGPAVHDHDT